MRVGDCFSRVLNPAGEPLFGGAAGAAPLAEEAWPDPAPAPGPARTSPDVRQPGGGSRGDLGGGESRGGGRPARAGARMDPDAPAAGAWAAGVGWEDLAGPAGAAGGPPASETDSDDDSLQPYDLSEGEDDGALTQRC